MLRLFLPIVLVLIAGGLFFVYTDPTYQHIKDLRAQEAEYDQALDKSKQILAQRNALISKRNTFSPDDVRKVERILPDNVDNIRLILDTETIAQRYNLHVQNVSLKAPQTTSADRSQLAVGDTGDPVGSVDFSFTVSATYPDFTRFLKDLERSVRIVDVRSISFSSGKGELSDYAVSLRTYWLK
jgi:hypothetical protein